MAPYSAATPAAHPVAMKGARSPQSSPRTPPTAGPRKDPIRAAAWLVPRHWARLSGVLMSARNSWAPVFWRALPTPVTHRAARSCGKLVDMPHPTIPRAVMAGPQTSRGLRPRRSASMPEGILVHRRAAAYADSVVPTAAAPTPKPLANSGSTGRRAVCEALMRRDDPATMSSRSLSRSLRRRRTAPLRTAPPVRSSQPRLLGSAGSV
mmetsp:Transcript_1696/g.4915  ORF Transcript_1696/g.4915 Transcript_1696/m.4915 type:complete len:208 (-) Transcript_1696:440-1063(-)